MRRLAIILIVASLVPVRAFAWGSEGHCIIAEIAEQYLGPGTAKQIRDLLAIENRRSLSDVANWADQIRQQHPETALWHFVDIPITASGYDASRDCPSENCVVAKIEEFATELHNQSLPARERLEALNFVVHFVGRRTNLHAVWDTGILAQAVQGDERAYALRLVSDITPEQIAAWQSGSTIDWANEGHGVAVMAIYGALPHGAGALSDNYEAAALPIVNKQLERAGIRLANVLNRALN